MRRLLEALTPDQERAWSAAACARLLEARLFAPRSTVLLYAPAPHLHEVDLGPLADALASTGVRLAVPAIDWPKRTMTPVLITSLDADLVDSPPAPGVPRIRVPRAGLPTLAPADLDAVLVPGLAFDPHGHRLGRGAGFYDRFLPTLPPSALIIGLAFDLQIVDHVPTDPHDHAMTIIVTESRLLRPTEPRL
jgi:5-formyltetrahydrofolate cyclo-ligase